jgi:hypothetical protein
MAQEDVARALEALAIAATAYFEAKSGPDVDGVAARVWTRGKLMIAGDAYGAAVWRAKQEPEAT